MKHLVVGDITCMKCDHVLDFDVTLFQMNEIDLRCKEHDAPVHCEYCEDVTTVRLADIRASEKCTCSVCLFWLVRNTVYKVLTSTCYVGTLWWILKTAQ